MIPTREQLVNDFYAASEDIRESQYRQRWSTMADSEGLVKLSLRIGDSYDRFQALDGLLPSHDIYRLSRIDWYAVRYIGDHDMTLYRFSAGSDVVTFETDQKIYRVFNRLFALDGGYRLRDCEAHAAEREAADIHAVDSACYR